jgi:hypothetical protein
MKFNEFLANHTDYLWSSKQQEMPVLPERNLNKYDTDTLMAVQGKEGGESLSKKMQKCNLVLKDGRINTDKSFDGIKFYMKLSYTSQAYQSDVLDELKEMVLAHKNGLDDFTIYSGAGFCQFILKGVCDFDRLYDIAEFALRIIARFRMIKMKSDTLIVATRRSFESDNVNFKNLSLAEIMTVVRDFDLDKSQVNKLSKSQIRNIQDKFEYLQSTDLLHEYNDVFKRLFNGYVDRNPEAIKRNLMIVIEFESIFRVFSTKIMSKLYGAGWVKTDFGRISKSIDMAQKNISKLTLYDWISILGKADSEKQNISEILGSNWEPVLKKAATIRNQVAHARMEDPLTMWSEIIDFLSAFLPIHSSIKAWKEG